MRNSPGRIITFYSYKGGTGRSMALANFAWILAASGKRVLAIDWDLEAPGLHRYFRPFLADPDLFETDGLIDMFWDLTVSAVQKVESLAASFPNAMSYPKVPPGGWPARVEIMKSDARILPVAPKVNWYANSEDRDAVIDAIEDATRRLDSRIGDKSFFPPSGYLDFIGAGRQGTTYSERVNSFSWKRFWDLGGPDILNLVKDHLRENYDWVLIDSRTGVSDTSGICTIHMPDTVAAFFTLNRQSIEGVAAILHSIRAYRANGVDGSKIGFFPVATRIENAEKQKLELARVYARQVLAEYLPKALQSSPREYWDKMEIGYRPAYAFEETLAAFGDATGAAGSTDTMLTQVEWTSQCITDDPKLRMPEIGEVDREQVLAKYALGTFTATTASESDDTDFLRNLRTKEQLWRTSESKWRLLLSGKELDLLTEEDRKSFGRNMSYYVIQSERMWKLLRVGQIVGSSVFLLVLLAYLVTVILSTGLFRSLGLVLFMPFTSYLMVLAGVLGAWFSAVCARTLVAAIRDKPEGVGLLQVFLISLTGPIGGRVEDYQADSTRRKQKKRANRLAFLIVCAVLILIGIGLAITQYRIQSPNPPVTTGGTGLPAYVPNGNEGSIVGTVAFFGSAPLPRKIDTSADSYCSRNPNLTTEEWKVSDGRLENVLVYVKDGTLSDGHKIADYNWAMPVLPARLDQRGCRYEPHVLGVRVDQNISISNSDETVHNVHFTPKNNADWNQGQPIGTMSLVHRLSQPEVMVPVKCNQHPWMKAYVAVLNNSFFDVTDSNGSFEIKGLPAGRYTLVAWHEGGSTGIEQTIQVTVTAKDTTSADFTFRPAGISRATPGLLPMMPAIEFPMIASKQSQK